MKNWNKTEKTDFSFRPSGFGQYDVAYKSPVTGKEWKAHITDMSLIDLTRNKEYPKRKDLDLLKWIVKHKANER